MHIRSFGYLGVRAGDLADWRHYGTGLLGMQMVDRSEGTVAFRMDDRRQRLIVQRDAGAPVAFFGWEVDDAAALDAVAARVEQAGVAVTRGTRALAGERFVSDLIVFADPAGNRIEVFHGPQVADEAFRPGRTISGFRTGPLGMGHAVLTVRSVDAVMPFYTEVLGFRLSDYALTPFKAYFFHVNSRHHSLALIETGKDGMHHLMVELYSLDDVGQAYDIAQHKPEGIGVTLGRHTNDFMTSFYSNAPSGFMVECGWGGRSISPETWRPEELLHGPSLWGHERSWLSAEGRAHAREMRERAAELGQRQPVQVLPGNHQLGLGVCPWWDAQVKGH